MTGHAGRVKVFLHAIRVQHWVKNLLVFLPLVTGHQVSNIQALANGAMAFLSLSLAASAGYLFNDLCDLQIDRAKPTTRTRPLAAGTMSVAVARVAIATLAAMSGVLGWFALPPAFTAALAAYFLSSVLYSLGIKRMLFLDVVFLTGLYVVRIIAGGIATGSFVSPWLLALSMFFFLSLALLKRYTELRESVVTGGTILPSGRGYLPADADILRSVGPASGYLSVFLLALYINSDQARNLYQSPELLWLAAPLLIYWITRMWLLANRGILRWDAVVFASRDPATYAVAVLIGGVLYLASVGVW